MRHAFLLLLAAAAPIAAQPFVVTSATPADYAAGLPSSVTLSFTFSEPLGDVTVGFGSAPVLVALPTGSAEVGEVTQSDDGATVNYAVTLQPDERYIFLVLDAVSAQGDRLARPFALNLTTRPSAGTLRFSGDATSSEARSLEGSLVALVTGDLASGAIEIVAVDVIEEGGATEPFSLGPAPFGLYTIGAVRLPFPDPEALAYGFYDPNGDGTPDIVFSQTGNDVTLAPPEPITADERFADVQAAANEAISNPRLTGIASSQVDDEGRARTWRYLFEGDSEHIEVVQVGLFALPVPSANDAFGFASQPIPFRDSDDALALANGAGGASFRAQQEGVGRTVRVTMGADPFLEGQGEAEWGVLYIASDEAGGPPLATFQTMVSMAVTTTAEPPPAEGGDVRVLTNPARESLRLGVVLGSPEAADLTLVDAQGRTVALLWVGALPVGETVVDVPLPSLAPGVYFARLAMRETVRIVPVTIIR